MDISSAEMLFIVGQLRRNPGSQETSQGGPPSYRRQNDPTFRLHQFVAGTIRQRRFASNQHHLVTLEYTKRSLSYFEDKRAWININESKPYGWHGLSNPHRPNIPPLVIGREHFESPSLRAHEPLQERGPSARRTFPEDCSQPPTKKLRLLDAN